MNKTIIAIGFCLLTSKVYGGMDVNKAVIHHSNSPDWDVKRIRKIQMKEKRFNDIGYHFIIRKNGDIEIGRPLSKIGAHAHGRNSYVGICLTGYNTFSKKQVKSLYYLLNVLYIKEVERHHDLCPGKGLNVEEIQEELDIIHRNGHCYDRYGKATLYRDWETANGENMWLKPFSKTCATWFYPIGTKLRVTNLYNGKSVIVRVNDRGPNENLVIKKRRIVDLSPSAFSCIAKLDKGEINVGIDKIK